jgi:hypothetical protein
MKKKHAFIVGVVSLLGIYGFTLALTRRRESRGEKRMEDTDEKAPGTHSETDKRMGRGIL